MVSIHHFQSQQYYIKRILFTLSQLKIVLIFVSISYAGQSIELKVSQADLGLAYDFTNVFGDRQIFSSILCPVY